MHASAYYMNFIYFIFFEGGVYFPPMRVVSVHSNATVTVDVLKVRVDAAAVSLCTTEISVGSPHLKMAVHTHSQQSQIFQIVTNLPFKYLYGTSAQCEVFE